MRSATQRMLHIMYRPATASTTTSVDTVVYLLVKDDGNGAAVRRMLKLVSHASHLKSL